MSPDDWRSVPIESGRYFYDIPRTGFVRRDGQGGSVLLPAVDDQDFETNLLKRQATVQSTYPGMHVARYTVRMPYWRGPHLPDDRHYPFVDFPQRLTTTSISVVLIPQNRVQHASMGFYFRSTVLPTLRERLRGRQFQGIIGNLGYYMTPDLINDRHRWSHKARYPAFPLPDTPSYIGFHRFKDDATGQVSSGIQGAHPAAVGIRQDGVIDILSDLAISGYTIDFGTQKVVVQSINDPDVGDTRVTLFTPALRTQEIEDHIMAAEMSAGADDRWQTFAPFIPDGSGNGRVNLFIANEGDGHRPVEKVIAVWEDQAPLPSYGAVLSFSREYFLSLFGDVQVFQQHYMPQPVHIVPQGSTDFERYDQMLGGLVPAVIDGQYVYCVDTVANLIRNLNRYGNACSPVAEAGKESRNFHPFIREPAGLLVQTENQIGWVLFDGRHELSIGASIADAAVILKKLERGGKLGGESVQQAVFIDGGSAMKVYSASASDSDTNLLLLNRVAAGSRNNAGSDPDGLNLYSSLSLALKSS
jgi:hypothetical protein